MSNTENLNAVCCCKGEECYVVMFEVHRKKDALRQIGRWASSGDLSLSWYDAAVMAEKIRGTFDEL